ncbi:aldehyde dehydrogenase [Parasegetibacter sp. NRK P23]|uniref:aldehyde dehydrogenase n=1 Tax=Parasegetibacter sp. NRK P23 TaxID=2942999 RepID=UPI002043E727|nr:aldehyde dehydrogenase [Parasegetibacter sp. NRK P23]MCM5529456.1 aldehyde dehydrogenase [Parasegetibacter sp. NRK P23]
MGEVLHNELIAMRRFFETGETRSLSWRQTQLKIMYRALEEYEEKIAAALFADFRKPLTESYVTETGMLKAEISFTLKNLRKWIRPEKPGTNFLNFPSKSRIYKEPLGVVLVIGPWNYPFMLTLLPMINAIGAGNCVVLKPSEAAPASSALMAEMIGKYFSPAYIKVVEGDGEKTVGELMNFRFDHVFFTGGSNIGKKIYEMAARQLMPVTLELGGKSPVVVAQDADIPVTAKRICAPKFSNAGQMCVAPDYVLAHESVAQRLLEEMKKCIRSFYGEEPFQSPDYARIINERQFSRLCSYLSEGRIFCGGKINAEELYIEPTIMVDIAPNTRIMEEEIFGPILPVLTYTSEEELFQNLSRHPSPLALYVFTNNTGYAEKLMKAFPFGGGCINNVAYHLMNPRLPFGGIGNSGIGAYHGLHGFHTFTHRKAVMQTPVWFDPSLKYPPFGNRLKWLRKFLK